MKYLKQFNKFNESSYIPTIKDMFYGLTDKYPLDINVEITYNLYHDYYSVIINHRNIKFKIIKDYLSKIKKYLEIEGLGIFVCNYYDTFTKIKIGSVNYLSPPLLKKMKDDGYIQENTKYRDTDIESIKDLFYGLTDEYPLDIKVDIIPYDGGSYDKEGDHFVFSVNEFYFIYIKHPRNLLDVVNGYLKKIEKYLPVENFKIVSTEYSGNHTKIKLLPI